MTFVVSLSSRDTVWLVADRRISWDHKHSDHGVKVMTLETSDGVAILGYAGLGETPDGEQPSEWMSNLLYGFDMSMRDALWKLTHGVREQLGAHVIGQWNHLVLVPAFVDGECRVYSIGLSKLGQVAYHQLRIQDPPYPAHLPPAPPRVIYTGSGGAWFANQQVKSRWVRELCSLAKKHDQRRVSDNTVADRLAALNLLVSHSVPTVSPHCFVVWLRRPGSKSPNPGHQNYEGTNRVEARSFPSIGTDPEGPALGDWILDQTLSWESDLEDDQC